MEECGIAYGAHNWLVNNLRKTAGYADARAHAEVGVHSLQGLLKTQGVAADIGGLYEAPRDLFPLFEPLLSQIDGIEHGSVTAARA